MGRGLTRSSIEGGRWADPIQFPRNVLVFHGVHSVAYEGRPNLALRRPEDEIEDFFNDITNGIFL